MPSIRIIRRTAVQYRLYQVLEILGREATRRQTKRGDKKTAHTKKARWESNHVEMIMELKLAVHRLSFLHDTC